MIKFSTDKKLSKNEYINWTNFVEQYNHDNPNDQICYEVVWKDDIYNVKIIELDVDRKDQMWYNSQLFQYAVGCSPQLTFLNLKAY